MRYRSDLLNDLYHDPNCAAMLHHTASAPNNILFREHLLEDRMRFMVFCLNAFADGLGSAKVYPEVHIPDHVKDQNQIDEIVREAQEAVARPYMLAVGGLKARYICNGVAAILEGVTKYKDWLPSPMQVRELCGELIPSSENRSDYAVPEQFAPKLLGVSDEYKSARKQKGIDCLALLRAGMAKVAVHTKLKESDYKKYRDDTLSQDHEHMRFLGIPIETHKQ
jgi:hypothetical protein